MAKTKTAEPAAPRNDVPQPAILAPEAETAEARAQDAELLERALTAAEEKEIMRRSVQRDPRQYIVSNLDVADAKQRRLIVNALNLPCSSLKDVADSEILVDGWILEAKMITAPETGEIRPGRALTLIHDGRPVCSFASGYTIEQFLLIRDSLDDSWPKPWRIYVHSVNNPKSGHDWFPLELLEPTEAKP